ncbi:uncharacterized protein [Nicotiana sylvestris]|uniref:uncharacterized protein n=1 Tax=Nicotiana sylvestris TaxID=4096 RepID=UPI00388CB80A
MLAVEYKLLTQRELTTAQKHAIMVAWHKPHKGSLNIDGAFRKRDNLAGLGGSFRDSNGQWIMGFQHHCLASSPLQAELEALKEGLYIAMTKGLTPLVIKTDSTKVVNAPAEVANNTT